MTSSAGDRVKQTKDSVDTTYVVDSVAENARVLMETTGANTIYYVYGHDLLYSIDGSGPHYQHNDSLGSVVAITDSTGAVEQTYDYDVFGVLRSAAGSSGNRYTFTGEENDASGLVYLRARYYEPAVGRFGSRDPFPAVATDTQSINRYVYVKNNPTNYVDPSGEIWAAIGKAAASVVKTVAKFPFAVQKVVITKLVPKAMTTPYKAYVKADQIYMETEKTHRGDGIDDAIRHAETSRREAAEFGPGGAFLFGAAHEVKNLTVDNTEWIDTKMDMWNNGVGIVAHELGVGYDLQSEYYRFWHNLMLVKSGDQQSLQFYNGING